jgi:hypothetical protein
MNRYEKQVVGTYEVSQYTINKPQKTLQLPHLSLGNDKKFILDLKGQKITGKWSTNDYGDFTLLEFDVNNKLSQGKIIGSVEEPVIEISIPANFYCPEYSILVFKRIKTNKK